MTDTRETPDHADDFATLTLVWDAAPEPVVQAAQMITFYAAYPSTAGDSADLEGFRL